MYDSKSYREVKEMTDQSKCVAFVVGMPRAGTTYISKLLNNHKNIVSVGESLYWGRLFVEPLEDGKYNQFKIDEIKERFKVWNWQPKVTYPDEMDFALKIEQEFSKISVPCLPNVPFDALANVFCSINKKDFFIEKTPHHINWLPRINEFYPDAKYVLAIRDPYSFMLSYKYQGLQKSKEIRDTFKKLYHPISCAIVWRKNYRSIQQACTDFPMQSILIEQEKLNTLEQLRSLESFLELDSFSMELIKTDNSSFEKENKSYQLEPIDVFWMNMVAGNEIRGSSYDYINVIPNPFMFLRSLLIFPYKALNAAYLLTKNSKKSIFTYLFSYLKK